MILKKKIRSAVIGLGVGAHQARTLAAHPNCELMKICDFNQNKLSEIGSEFQDVIQTQNDMDVLSDPDIDLVCVASYDEFHFRQVMDALNAKKHVYVEKPICLTKEELKEINKKLKMSPNLKISSNMVLRTTPLFKKVFEEVKSNKIGEIYHIEADYLWGRKHKIISGWRSETDYYSIIYGAAIHMIDLVLWITKKKPISVKALGSNIMVKGTKQKHNDFAILILEFEDKMSVKISAHGGGVHPHFHTLKIYGKNLTFVHDYNGTFWIDSNDSDQKFITERAAYPSKNLRSQALISFVNYLYGFEQNLLVSKEDVLNVMSVCLAAEKAVNLGDTVYIEYL